LDADHPSIGVNLPRRITPVKGIGLEQPGISGQMALRMLACGRGSNKTSPPADPDHQTADRRAHNPTSPGIGLALGQNREGRVVAVQAFGGQDMGLDPPEQRFERGSDAGKAGPEFVPRAVPLWFPKWDGGLAVFSTIPVTNSYSY
jgi:hypothetical protein